MAQQEHKQKQVSKKEAEQQEVQAKDVHNAGLEKSTTDVVDSIDDVLEDDLLADIDSALGEISNAEQFVAEYVQKGGQ